MSALITTIIPYLPFVYILIQFIAYLLIKNDLLKLYIKISDEFVTQKDFDGFKKQQGYIRG